MSGEPELWDLVLNDRAPIPVDRNMHMHLNFLEQQTKFFMDGEVI